MLLKEKRLSVFTIQSRFIFTFQIPAHSDPNKPCVLGVCRLLRAV